MGESMSFQSLFNKRLWTPEPRPTLPLGERIVQHKLRRQVRRAFDADALRRVCVDPAPAGFERYGIVNRFGDGPDDFYVHRDNGSSVLAVAHLDSVQGKRRFKMAGDRANPIVYSPTLDDRLGAYVIAELLPALGIVPDVLLTSGEESCNSSARLFDTDKQYNWMFSFDRGGTDVVAYQYDTSELRERIHAAGAPVGDGSYSDIADLDHLGCAGVNWGVAYRDYHGSNAYVPLNDLFLSVARFVRFWGANADVAMPHASDHWWQRGADDGATDECEACGEDTLNSQTGICATCGYDEWSAWLNGSWRSHSLTEKEWTRIEAESSDVAG
jgi:ribosomal protein L37E